MTVSKRLRLGKWNPYWRVLSIVLVCSMLAMILPVPAGTAAAEATAQSVITDYQPTIHETVDVSGFKHPGIGLTKEVLENLRTQIRAGKEPWTTYFNQMLLSATADKAVTSSNQSGTDPTMPASVAFDSQSFNSKFIADGLKAYTQAILYVVTGDEVYRANAMRIIRIWSRMDPTQYAYFVDSHIHTGIPLNRMVTAAEILRYTSTQNTALEWTDQDTVDFTSNLINPVIETFQHTNYRFMNQHLYPLLGAISGYIFTGNLERYHEGVEWFTVNKTAVDQGQNGAIKALFRLVDTNDLTGEPVDPPVVQHVEMGRDQAHGAGDITNAEILARLLLAQGTKVDPVEGTVSTADNAVGPYEFLDNRILKAADFFARFMMGYDTPWIPVAAHTDELGNPTIVYKALSWAYRGRIGGNVYDLYYYYKYQAGVDMEQAAPYFAEMFAKRHTFYWESPDGGGDYWLYIPKEAEAEGTQLLPKLVNDSGLREIEDRSAVISGDAVTMQEAGTSFARITATEAGSKIALVASSAGEKTIGLRIRTNGTAKLELKVGIDDTITLPDTKGQWKYVTYAMNNFQFMGDLLYINVKGSGTTVDIDHINVAAGSQLTPPVFKAGSKPLKLFAYEGSQAAVRYDFSATDAGAADIVTYQMDHKPAGADFNESTGAFSWTPPQAGNYPIVVGATDGATFTTKDFEIIVSPNRQSSVEAAIAPYNASTIYVQSTLDKYQSVYTEILSLISTASDEVFYQKLAELSAAVYGLKEVTPLLKDGSMNYRDMFVTSTMGTELPRALDGAADSFVGYYLAQDRAHIMDFGPGYRVSADAFELQVRASFPERIGGVAMFGSNDKENWVRLTPGLTEVNEEMQRLPVAEEHRNAQYRFLKMQMIQPPPVTVGLEISEFRIHGLRHEVINKLETVSISSPQSLVKRIVMGNTINLAFKTTEPVHDVKVRIQGVDVAANTVDNTNWTAQLVANPNAAAGRVKFSINYNTADGRVGAETIFTTDDSFLILADESNMLSNVLEIADLQDSSGRTGTDLLNTAAVLFDGNSGSITDFRLNGSGAGGYITFDFKAGGQARLTKVEMLARQDNNFGRIGGTVVQGSNDNLTWKTISGVAAGIPDWQTLTINDSMPYRYIRIVNGNNWFGNMSEVRLHGNVTVSVDDLMADADSRLAYDYTKASFFLYRQELSRIKMEMAKPGFDEAQIIKDIKKAKEMLVSYETLLSKIPVQPVMVRANEKYYGNDSITEAQNGWYAFDGNTGTFVHTRSKISWVDVDFGAGNEKSTEAFRFLPRNGQLGRANGTVFKGSNDGVNWVDLYKIAGVTAYKWHTVKNSDKTPYRYIRIYDDHSGFVNFEEIEFMERGVDKTLLALMVDKAEAAQTAGIYSAESLQSLQAVVDAGKLIANKADATQAEVVAAENDVQAALGALQFIQGMPVLTGLADLMVNAEQTLALTLEAVNAVTNVVYGVSGALPAGASFNAATRTFIWTPARDQGGMHDVTFTVAADGMSSSRLITITVKGQPVVGPAETVEGTARQLLTYKVPATDPTGETLVYSASGLPSGAKLDGKTGVFTWNPNQADYGTNPVTFTVSNGKFAVSRTVSFKVGLDILPAADYTRASYDGYHKTAIRVQAELQAPGADKIQLLAALAQAEALLVQVPVSLYSFEGNLNNAIGSTHGTVAGALTYSAGKLGQAIDLNGTDSYAQLPAKHPLSGYNEMTVSSWVFWRGGNAWQRIFDFGNNTNQYMFLSPSSNNNSTGKMRFAIKNNGGEQAVETAKMATNQWVHVAVTLSGGTAKLYVNGQLAATALNVTIKPSDFRPSVNYIGKSMWPDPLFNGKIDEFSVYNYALSAEEVQGVANSTAKWSDKTLLTLLLSEAAALEPGRYTPASAAALQAAAAGAQQVQSNRDATQQQIDSSTGALKAALGGLEEMGVRLTGPESVVGGQMLDLTYSLMNVTSSVYAKMATFNYNPALLQFVGVDSLPEKFTVIGSTYGGGQIKVIEAGLNSPVTGSVNLLKLRFLTVTPDHTVTSSVYMSDVVIADQNGAETSLYVGSAYNVEIVKVDKTALYAAIVSSNTLLESTYKPSTWGNFAAKRSVAESVYGSAAATQSDVNTAAVHLQAAISGLQLRADVSGLNAKIVEAEAIIAAARQADRIGSFWGQYPQAAVDALKGTITAGKNMALNGDASQIDLDLEAVNLADERNVFLASANTTARIGDLARAAVHYGDTSDTGSNWNAVSMYDFNHDGEIGLIDLGYLVTIILDQMKK
jgi:hypothetical protein